MSNPPQSYRIYCYDQTRKMVSGDWLQAASDEEAISKATAAGFGSRCEIWQGRRLVAKLSQEQQSAA